MRMRAPITTAAILTALSLTAGGCSLAGGDDGGSDTSADGTTITLVAHESFELPKKLVADFEESSGLTLRIEKLGDAGALTNQLVLTKDKPVGDVVFGIDNTFATRAVDEGVFAPYAPQLPPGAERDELPGDTDDALTPIDSGNVCVNVDDAWFAKEGLTPPASIDDLTKPAYKDLLVVPGASTSSPGLAFLLATIARYGESGWQDYWTKLTANGAKVVKGWSDAYYTDFTFSGGQRPIVVSYDSSPAFTIDEATKKTTTSALLDSCYRQVEYAGLLKGGKDGEGSARSEAGAKEVVDWLLSPEVQAALPTSMYVFPVDERTELPADWAAFAKRPTSTKQVDPAEVTAQRQTWIEQWNEIISR